MAPPSLPGPRPSPTRVAAAAARSPDWLEARHPASSARRRAACWASGCSSATARSRTRWPRPTPGSDQRTKAGLTPAGNILTSAPGHADHGLRQPGREADSGARADSILHAPHRPRHQLISMLSIPRDLNVPIPGHGREQDQRRVRLRRRAASDPHRQQPDRAEGEPRRDSSISRGSRADRRAGRRPALQPQQDRVVAAVRRAQWRFKKGTSHLDGRRALAYSRIRHTTNPRDSDITRTERQQRVMPGPRASAGEPSAASSTCRLGTAIAKPLTTDLTANELIGIGWTSSAPAARWSATWAARRR